LPQKENQLLLQCRQSSNPGELTTIGFIELAFGQLKKRFGIYNFRPLLEPASRIFANAGTNLLGLPFLLPSWELVPSGARPFLCINTAGLALELK